MGRIPEQGLVNLAKLLISPDTPLRNIKLDAEEEAEELRAGKKEASWSWQSVWDGVDAIRHEAYSQEADVLASANGTPAGFRDGTGEHAPHFRCKGRSRQTVFVECNNKFDASLRVKGVKAKVFKYVGDFEHAADWYPGAFGDELVLGGRDHADDAGITSVTRVRGEGIALKNQYTVERTILRMQHTSTYEVIDIAPGRKVVYSGTSPLHTAVHELYFMEDPTVRDAAHLDVRSYEVIDIAPGRKVVYSGTSPLHTAVHELYFMEDPTVRDAATVPSPPTAPPPPFGRNSKVSMEDAATQESASVKFQQLQKAYNVLKNVEHRRLYDSGQLVSELVQ
ncbi:hypothetical protein TSOC_005899 [Tetrabaena socialis]|uniref:J domain-containing protein n=1 Tax=Tetrabaena socialis TaxID=47790 RepID=A0A2J8A547_9CHLO|nr:hypothetical protein TSOC_005899 [Tetrabaena socialis]|eukprot:PNH07636.1 hypothetical protein TSOC_005899 [Tetrabaena socialis]